VYALTVLEISMAGFFEPARSAIIPSLIPKKDLVTANALSGATWSVMLALGAALGGVVVSLWGLKTAFIIDSLSFLVSAWFIYRIRMEDKPQERSAEPSKKSGVENFLEGVRYIFTRPLIFILTFLKSGLAVVGGVMTLIPLYANQLSLHPANVAMATGIMYSCRGIGAALGPLLVKGIFGGTSRTLHISIAISFFLGSLSLLLFGYSGNIWTASFSLALIGMCGAVIWVFSTTLIHLEADNRYLGRVFSMEMGSLTLVMGMSTWAIGRMVDKVGLTPNEAAQALAGWFLVPAIIWTLFTLLAPNPAPKEQPLEIVPPVDPSGFTPPPIDRQQKG